MVIDQWLEIQERFDLNPMPSSLACAEIKIANWRIETRAESVTCIENTIGPVAHARTDTRLRALRRFVWNLT